MRSAVPVREPVSIVSRTIFRMNFRVRSIPALLRVSYTRLNEGILATTRILMAIAYNNCHVSGY